MFYPANLLCRGGRLHIVWIAESQPAKLREIRKVQLEKVNFVQLCEYICQVIKSESGSSRSRFSLRLSSKLMRGLARLYERKMNVFVGDVFVMNAAMIKVMYAKATAATASTAPRRSRKRPRTERPITAEDQPSEEEDLEERLLNSIVLARNNDITLRECELPVLQLPTNDFGDEGPAAITELLGEQTVEQMMARDISALVTSAREFAASPHSPHMLRPRLDGLGDMDILPELNMTLLDKAAADGEIPVEIQEEIPRISEILPNIPAPVEEQQRQEEHVQPVEDEGEFELEVLSDVGRYTRCRHRRLKMVDREDGKTLDTNYMRSRIEDVYVETRTTTIAEDMMEFKWVPAELLLRRPAWTGPGHTSCANKTLYHLYDRNLFAHKPATPDRRERPQQRRRTTGQRTPVTTDHQPMENIQEQQQVLEEEQQQQLEVIEHPVEVIQQQQIEFLEEQPMQIERAEQPMPANVSEMPTVLSIAEKTATDVEYIPPAKIQRLDVSVDAGLDGTARRATRLRSALRSSGVLPSPQGDTSRGRKCPSGGSETPLGSVDRTPVCLNISDPVTESAQLLKDSWGPEGTIMNFCEIARNCRGRRIDVRVLYELGPKIPGKPKTVIVGKIFSSLLRLKQHQCLSLEKDETTLEITNIKLGPKLRECADML